MNEKLKPCPFCGGKAQLTKGRTRQRYARKWVEYIKYGCYKCQVFLPREVWNTRSKEQES